MIDNWILLRYGICRHLGIVLTRRVMQVPCPNGTRINLKFTTKKKNHFVGPLASVSSPTHKQCTRLTQNTHKNTENKILDEFHDFVQDYITLTVQQSHERMHRIFHTNYKCLMHGKR